MESELNVQGRISTGRIGEATSVGGNAAPLLGGVLIKKSKVIDPRAYRAALWASLSTMCPSVGRKSESITSDDLDRLSAENDVVVCAAGAGWFVS